MKRKKELVLGLLMALVMTLALPAAALGDNQSGQAASTSYATNLEVVGKVADTAITTITFDQGAPSATISAPYNDVDTSSSPQFLDGAASEPVVRIRNNTGGNLVVTLATTTWTNGIVVAEDYELVDTGTTNIAAVTTPLSTDGSANTTATGVTISNGAYGALYLEVTLGAVAGKSGTSTLTVLGETP